MISSRFNFFDESVPLLSLSIHSGHQLPHQLWEDCGISEEERFREEDPYTDQFAALFPNHIILETSRFAVDLNRRRDMAVYLKPEHCWGLPINREHLDKDTIQALYQDYDRWYEQLDYAVHRLLARHEFLIVLDLHSFNHRRGGPVAEPDPQIDNPDIILGRSNMSQKYYPTIEKLRLALDGRELIGRKLDCRCDVKFPGGQLSRYLNAKYPDRLFCVAIEIKKIFMDEWTGELYRQDFEDLKSFFHRAVNEQWLM